MRGAKASRARDTKASTRGGSVNVLTVSEAAKILRTTDKTVSKLCEKGEIPARNVGTEKKHAWRIDEDALKRWMLHE